MSYLAPSIPSEPLRYAAFCCAYQLVTKTWPTGNSPHTASIHVLDNDSLLNVFYLYRPPILDGNENDEARVMGGKWDRERWWYKLAHVCQRWRKVILGSASYLDLCLVCTYGTPVAHMLAHSPPLPLVINYIDPDRHITAEEEGIILALEQRDRVRRIRLEVALPILRKFIGIIDEEYPMLESLIMAPPNNEDKNSILLLPETLRAPHLRHLALGCFFLTIRSRLLTTAVGLTMFSHFVGHPSSYFQPNILLQWLSLMPQLETLIIIFFFPVPSRDVERQLRNKPITTHVTLPNLRQFSFMGVSAYLEAVVRRITTPRLEKLSIGFYKQLMFSIPRLGQFMDTTNLRFDSAKLEFNEDRAYVGVYFREAKMYNLEMAFHCSHLDWQVSSVVQMFNSLNLISSTVEHLSLKHRVHRRSSDEHNEVDRTEWRKLLRPFSNVKTVHVDDGLVKELSRSLRLDDGELPLETLPELQELTYSEDDDTRDAFKSFIDARQDAGRPVTLTVVEHPTA